MRLSVAICTRNRERLLAQTLESCIGLRIPGGLEWELLVVDNGSTDGTREVLRRFAPALPLRVIDEPVAGKSRALNRAVEAASGDYVLWTDDDVLLSPGWLEAYALGVREWPDAVLLGGPVEPWFEVQPPRWIRDVWPRLAVAYAAFDLGPEPCPLVAEKVPHGANVAVRMAEQRRFLYDLRLGPGVSRGLRGEETTVFHAMVAEGLTGRWLPQARLRHFIPKERLRTGYVFDYFYGLGTFDALTRAEPVHRRMPLWVLKECLVAGAAFCVTRPVRRTAVWVGYLDRAARALGWLAGTRQVQRRRGG